MPLSTGGGTRGRSATGLVVVAADLRVAAVLHIRDAVASWPTGAIGSANASHALIVRCQAAGSGIDGSARATRQAANTVAASKGSKVEAGSSSIRTGVRPCTAGYSRNWRD